MLVVIMEEFFNHVLKRSIIGTSN
uniref:Uncharacterized protein n=1 Tax=Vitis vinifera TaxID=29760 RepID=F6H5T4_VITVI